MSEGIDFLRKRLKYTVARRAKLEVEEYLKPVLGAVDELNEREVKLLLEFLQLNDMDLWDILTRRRRVPPQFSEALKLLENLRRRAL